MLSVHTGCLLCFSEDLLPQRVAGHEIKLVEVACSADTICRYSVSEFILVAGSEYLPLLVQKALGLFLSKEIESLKRLNQEELSTEDETFSHQDSHILPSVFLGQSSLG